MAKISKRMIDRLQLRKTQYIIWDDHILGFGVVVRPTGNNSFIYNFRNIHGRERRVTIGRVGQITTDQARRKAEDCRAEIRNGADPMALKNEARKAATVDDLFEKYLESHAFERKAASTKQVDRGRIRNHLSPLLGRSIVETIDLDMLERVFASISDGKTAVRKPSGKKRGTSIVTGGAGTSRASIRLLRTILKWGVRSRMVPPEIAELASYVEIGRDGRRDTILEDPQAYSRLWQTMEDLVEAGRLRKPVAGAIKVIALTGARRGEILNLTWSMVDLEAGILILPVDAHKTGRRTGETRVIGLPQLAKEIIEEQPRRGPDDAVFQPARGAVRMDLGKPWRLIRKEAGLPEGIGLHGLRHSLASRMAMEGAEAAEIMTALGHRDISTSQGYVHWAKNQRQGLAERAAASITAAVQSRS